MQHPWVTEHGRQPLPSLRTLLTPPKMIEVGTTEGRGHVQGIAFLLSHLTRHTLFFQMSRRLVYVVCLGTTVDLFHHSPWSSQRPQHALNCGIGWQFAPSGPTERTAHGVLSLVLSYIRVGDPQ
jgi:hypothetical protein